MQSTYVKLKLLEKAIRVLILIMIFVQTCSCDHGLHCLGPIWKVYVHNDDNGYVGVKNGSSTIFAKSTNYLYKISALNSSVNSSKFYLFDGHAKKFLCWKKSLDKMRADKMRALGIQQIKNRNMWDYCRFQDIPSKTHNTTHIHLHRAGYPENRMQFDKNGRYLSKKKIETCKEKIKSCRPDEQCRHESHKKIQERCEGHNNFMVYWHGQNECYEACTLFCGKNGKNLRSMPELSTICRKCHANKGNTRNHRHGRSVPMS